MVFSLIYSIMKSKKSNGIVKKKGQEVTILFILMVTLSIGTGLSWAGPRQTGLVHLQSWPPHIFLIWRTNIWFFGFFGRGGARGTNKVNTCSNLGALTLGRNWKWEWTRGLRHFSKAIKHLCHHSHCRSQTWIFLNVPTGHHYKPPMSCPVI